MELYMGTDIKHVRGQLFFLPPFRTYVQDLGLFLSPFPRSVKEWATVEGPRVDDSTRIVQTVAKRKLFDGVFLGDSLNCV